MFILKKFRTKSKYYIYDSNTNNIIDVAKEIYDNIEFLLKKNRAKDFCEPNYKIILSAINEGVLGAVNDLKMEYPFSDEEYLEKLKDSIQQLVLCTTENCNLRCKYCVYSGGYQVGRVHTFRHMSFATMKSAIDFYYKHSSNAKMHTISFYGGEPLLNIERIKKATAYANTLFKTVNFIISTNGILLGNDFIKWFVENNNVMIIVSLDSPKEVHDTYRIDKNGNATYEKIIKNISNIPSGVLKKRVRFQSVYANDDDLEKMIQYYNINNHIIPMSLTSVEKDSASSEILHVIKHSDLNVKAARKKYKKMLQEYINKRPNSEENIYKDIFDNNFRSIHFRSMDKIGSMKLFSGICIPFVRKLFIDIDGNIAPCEKADYLNNFGNIKTGFDVSKIKELLSVFYEIMNKRCRKCWASRFCYFCHIYLYTGAKIDINLVNEKCKKIRRYIKQDLINYCSIREKNNHFFDFLIDK